MRAILILAVLLPMAILAAWVFTRPIIARINRQKHIAELERENRRLDSLLCQQGGQRRSDSLRKR